MYGYIVKLYLSFAKLFIIRCRHLLILSNLSIVVLTRNVILVSTYHGRLRLLKSCTTDSDLIPALLVGLL
jgi:hypothetical protein